MCLKDFALANVKCSFSFVAPVVVVEFLFLFNLDSCSLIIYAASLSLSALPVSAPKGRRDEVEAGAESEAFA